MPRRLTAALAAEAEASWKHRNELPDNILDRFIHAEPRDPSVKCARRLRLSRASYVKDTIQYVR